MAYTYDDFVTAAKNAGLYDSFGQDDLITAQSNPEYGLSLLKLQQDAQKAATEEQKLLVQEAVNQLRGTYGVAGTQAGTAGSFQYDRETDYQKLLGETTNPSSFNYDYKADPTYGAVKESWLTDGDRTRDKVLGEGTVPQNDWAGTAAQQGGNYYDAKLTDQIPTMYQTAYDEYLNEQNKELSKLEAVTTDRNFDQTAYLQQLQLDQAAAQQKFANDLTLHQQFGTAAPTMPELDNLTPGTDTAYSYGKDSEYQEALDAVVNQDPFSYSHLDDPLYGAARKTSLREGDRMAADTLAEINARTGGVASSYGVRAASDAGNAYNEQLNSQIPGLRQTAYQEYLGDFEAKRQGLAALEADRTTDYQNWLTNYELQEAAKQQEFENALALYKVTGLTPEIAAVLGVPYVKSGSGARKKNGLTYGDVRDEFYTSLSHGGTQTDAANLLAAAVNKGYITKSEAGKIASGYTAQEQIWDRHG